MKNLSREFATMTDEERRRFAQEQGTAAGDDDAADEVALGDPRDDDRTGRQYPSLHAETADPDARDGDAALLDDAAHARAVEAQRPGKQAAKRRPKGA
jgi:hypothetical protein